MSILPALKVTKTQSFLLFGIFTLEVVVHTFQLERSLIAKVFPDASDRHTT